MKHGEGVGGEFSGGGRVGCVILLVFGLLGSVEAIMVQEECCLLLWISLSFVLWDYRLPDVNRL